MCIRDSSEVESVTIDPHKMGYVPYAAGGIAIRLKEMRNVISYFAPYVFDRGVEAPDMLGAYTLSLIHILYGSSTFGIEGRLRQLQRSRCV